jgi:hypothetical protein
MIYDRVCQDFPKYPDHVLKKGAAIGIDESGKACHFQKAMKFIGFLEGQSETKAGVWVRGSAGLWVIGATDADRGKPVYCLGPNEFSLEQVRGSAEIGAIRFVQGNESFVFFRRHGDPKPLFLHVDVV